MHLVIIFGPQAVGKMAVGRELARLTTYRLLHNHATIEPLLEVFDWGTPAFETLKAEFRRRVIEEAVASGMPGLVTTYVWALDVPEDTAEVEALAAPVLRAGGRVDLVELYADQDVRLAREGTALRLDHKPSKRDVAWQREHLVDWGARYRLSTGPDQALPLDWPHLRVDNGSLSPTEAAEVVVRRLGLPRRFEAMSESTEQAGQDEDRVERRAELLPEEESVGSADPHAQAEAILAESDERTDDPEGTRESYTQTPDPETPYQGRAADEQAP